MPFILLYILFLSCATEIIPPNSQNETTKILTWNVQNFPKYGSETSLNIINILNEIDFDIIAFQEVYDCDEFEDLANSDSSWEFLCESSRLDDELDFGGLAYLYNKQTFQLESYYTYTIVGSPRDMLIATFIHIEKDTLHIMNNHFKCCGDGILDYNNSSDEEFRRLSSINVIKKYIDTNYDDENVIILGDLNDEVHEKENNVFISMINDSLNYYITDMSIAKGSPTYWSYPSWPSHLDHIIITNELFDFFDSSVGINTILVESYFDDNLYEYRQTISDHRPVLLELNFN